MQCSPPVRAPMRSFRLSAPPGPPLRASRGLVLSLALVIASALGFLWLALGSGQPDPAPAAWSVVESSMASDAWPIALPRQVPLDPLAADLDLLALGPLDEPPSAESAAPPAAALPAAEIVPPGGPAAGSNPAPSPAVASAPAPPRPRLEVVAAESTPLRVGPSPESALVATLGRGTIVEELPGNPVAARYGWRRVLWEGREGWMAGYLLRPAS